MERRRSTSGLFAAKPAAEKIEALSLEALLLAVDLDPSVDLERAGILCFNGDPREKGDEDDYANESH